MEMQNSAVTQMMSTQTSILEEIKRLREKDDLRQRFADISTNPTASQNTQETAPANQIDMYKGEDYYEPMSTEIERPFDPSQHYMTPSVDIEVPPMMQQAQPTATPAAPSAVNPSNYGTVATTPPKIGLMAATSQSADTVLNYDPSRMSKEASAEYFAQRSQGVQMGAVDAAGKTVAVGGALASFAIPGLLPSIAVGGAVAGGTALVAGSMAQGAEDALAYQDILRRDGYKAFNAFESTTEYGGIGMNLDDQQDMSGYLRDLADESYLENDEVAGLLQGALDNKLLKSVTDMKDFKERFSKIVEGVKEISLTLDKTLDEAIEFMGEMERRGIKTDKMSQIGSQFKIGASMLGMDANEFTQQALAQTDAIVGGTSMSAENVMEGLAYDSYLMSAIENVSAEGDGVTKQFIKNNGGGAAMAGAMAQASRSYIEDGQGSQYALSLAAPAFEQQEDGSFQLNEAKFDEMINGDMSFLELQQQSTEYLSTLDPTDQARLVQSSGQIFNQTAESDDVYNLLGRQMEAFMYEAGEEMDSSTALIKMGVVQDYEQADILSQMIELGTNEDTQAQFDSRALKEEMDAAERSRNPGIMKKLKYQGKKFFTNPIGDSGQWVSDTVGDFGEDLQMFAAGIEEDGIVGGELLPEFDAETVEQLYVGEDSAYSEMVRNIAEIRSEDGTNLESDEEYKEMFIESQTAEAMDFVESEFSTEDYDRLLDDLDGGNASAEDLIKLRSAATSGDLDGASQERADYILNKASGEYEGLGGMVAEAWDLSKATSSWNADSWNGVTATVEGLIGGEDMRPSNMSTMEEIEDLESNLRTEMETAQEELLSLVSSEDIGVGPEQARELEVAIRSGDTEAVKALTTNKQANDLAAEFQDLVGRNDELTGVKNQYMDFTRYAASSSEYAGEMLNYLESTGAFEEGEIDDLYSGYEKDAENLMKNYETMDAQELYEAQTKLHQAGEDVFAYMDSDKVYKVAEDLAEKHDSIDMSELMMEGSENTVDPAKLYDALMNDVVRQQQSGESEAEEVLSDSGDAETAAKDHKDAMDSFLTAFASEAKALREVVEDMENGQIKSSYTSAGS